MTDKPRVCLDLIGNPALRYDTAVELLRAIHELAPDLVWVLTGDPEGVPGELRRYTAGVMEKPASLPMDLAGWVFVDDEQLQLNCHARRGATVHQADKLGVVLQSILADLRAREASR